MINFSNVENETKDTWISLENIKKKEKINDYGKVHLHIRFFKSYSS